MGFNTEAGSSRSPNHAAAVESVSIPPASTSSRLRILLAEDNTTNQLVVALKLLERLGYRAEVVADGAEVITALSQGDFDLVLMDCQMPHLDGFEATAQIRKGASSVRNPRIPIIALTANALAEDAPNLPRQRYE